MSRYPGEQEQQEDRLTQLKQQVVSKLADIPEIVRPTNTQIGQVLKLLDDEGFQVLFGLLRAERLGCLETLSQLPMGTPQQSAQIAVTQGITRGLARVPELVVELVTLEDPTEKEPNHD